MIPTIGWMRRHAVAGYFVVAYAITWAIWIPMAIAGTRVYQGSAWPSHIPGLFGPLAAAFVMSALIGGRAEVKALLRRLIRWRVDPRWFVIALSPALLFIVAAVIMRITSGAWPDLAGLGAFSGLPAVAAPLMFVLLVVAAFGEETGWRGYAAERMLPTRGLLITSLVIGALWALWHVPSFLFIENYRALGVTILPGFAIGIVAGSIVLAWLYRASGHSVLIVALWHGTYNLVSGTAASSGLPAALVSSAVILWAVAIVIQELRNRPAHTELPRMGFARG